MLLQFAMRWSLVIATGLVISSVVEAAASPCDDTKVVTFDRLRDLPAEARAALGPMADVGEPFQVTDVVSAPPLPWRRFQRATKIGCRLHVDFERGGRGLGFKSMELRSVGASWERMMVDRRNPAPR